MALTFKRSYWSNSCVVMTVMVSCVVILLVMLQNKTTFKNVEEYQRQLLLAVSDEVKADLLQPKNVYRDASMRADIKYNVVNNKLDTYKTSGSDNDESFVGLEQTDPKLIDYVKSHLLLPSQEPYNLTHPERMHFSQYGQSGFAETNFLHGMGGGFFLEVGALDGEDKSNTLYHEKYRGWTGLLIEPNPKLYTKLESHHRKCFAIKTGLSFTTVSGVSYFRPAGGVGRVSQGNTHGKEEIQIKMIPLYSLLLALNTSQVDLFSLDIEGDEMKVLETLPWDKVRFRLLCIEINHVPGGTKGMINYLEPRGYTFLGTRIIDAWFGIRELLQETMDLDKYLKDNDIPTKRQYILDGRIYVKKA